MSVESPEQLLDAFRAAALSVTKLYKTSAAAQTKARADGYQDCLDDLLAFLDKENIGLSDGEGWRIRIWATERLDGRDSVSQTLESEDEGDKAETVSSPDIHRTSSATQLSAPRSEVPMRDSAPPTVQAIPARVEQPAEIIVPTQENFTFRSQHPLPQESYLNLESLDLSDSRPLDSNSHTNAPTSLPRSSRIRHGGAPGRPGSRSAGHLGRGGGQKRKINFAEIFDLGSLGGKDVFGGGKRSRHA
jgi:hypothetical protein